MTSQELRYEFLLGLYKFYFHVRKAKEPSIKGIEILLHGTHDLYSIHYKVYRHGRNLQNAAN